MAFPPKILIADNLKYFKPSIWGGHWKTFYFILYDDSKLEWYKDKENKLPTGSILLKQCTRLMGEDDFFGFSPGLANNYGKQQLLGFVIHLPPKMHYWIALACDGEKSRWYEKLAEVLPPNLVRDLPGAVFLEQKFGHKSKKKNSLRKRPSKKSESESQSYNPLEEVMVEVVQFLK